MRQVDSKDFPTHQNLRRSSILIEEENRSKSEVSFHEKVDRKWKRVVIGILDVPPVSKELSYLCAVLNVIIPGLGTVLAAVCTKKPPIPISQIVVGLI